MVLEAGLHLPPGPERHPGAVLGLKGTPDFIGLGVHKSIDIKVGDSFGEHDFALANLLVWQRINSVSSIDQFSQCWSQLVTLYNAAAHAFEINCSRLPELPDPWQGVFGIGCAAHEDVNGDQVNLRVVVPAHV